MSEIHFRIQKPVTGKADEPARFACLEEPCTKIPLLLHTNQLARHAQAFHGVSKIRVNLKPGDNN